VPGNAHLYFQLPLTPVYAGDSFSTQLYANTDGRACQMLLNPKP